VTLCRDLKLFPQAIVAINSSKFKAVNSGDRDFTPNKIERRQQQTEQSIQRYHDAIEAADGRNREVEAKEKRLREKIDSLRELMRDLKRAGELLKDLPEMHVPQTDPGSRSTSSQAKETGVVGYNVQVAVDAKRHLMVTHEVTNLGSDDAQLSKMAEAAREAIAKRRVKALADHGYYRCTEI